MSVAVATDPSITYDNDGSGGNSTTINPSGWQWGAKSSVTVGSDTGEFFQLQDSSNGAIKNLTLVFDKLTDPTNTPTQAVTEASSVKTLTIKGNGQVSGNNAVFTISNSGSGKGILLGAGSADDTRGTLTFDFLGSQGASTDTNWNGATDTLKRKVVLNFADSTTLSGGEKVSLVGNILIKAGMGIANTQGDGSVRPYQHYKNTNEFEATFGEDMIGNITINPSDIKDPTIIDPATGQPYATSKQSGYRDIKSTFTFTAGSLTGNILSEAGENTFTFNGSDVKIDGSVTANNGYYDTTGKWGAGSESEYVGGINTITFTHTGTITGNITADNAGQNKITFSENGTILGKIISGKETDNNTRASNANHNNLIVFNGTSATIGASSSTQASIIVYNNDNSFRFDNGRGRLSNNTIVFNSTTNKLYLNKIHSVGEPGTYGSSKISFNILSFNDGATTNTIQASELKGEMGINIIGKNLYSSTNNTYSSNLFSISEINGGNSRYKVNALVLKNNFATEFLKTDYQASGNFTFGNISASYSGGNYINVSGTTSITGDIVSETHNSSFANHNNTLVLSGTSATLGSKGSEISIIVDNDSPDGRDYKARSVNSIILNANTNTLHLDQLSAKGYYAYKSNNILSINSSGTNTLNATAVVATSKGYNFIGKNLITQAGGYASALFDSPLDIKSDFATHFMTNTYTASGTYTLGSVTATAGENYINAGTVNIGKDPSDNSIVSTSAGANYIYADTLSVEGNISATSGNGTTITFLSSGKILGNISAHDTSNTIKSANGTLAIGASGATVDLIAKGGGANGSNTIIADTLNAYFDEIITGQSGWATYTNTIEAQKGNVSIQSLSAKNGGNNLTLASASILGSITANDGTNRIATSGTLVIGASGSGKSVNMTATGGGGSGSNTITANAITAYFGNIDIGTGGWKTYSNAITANSGTINITSLNTRLHGSGGSDNTSKNTVTLKSGTLAIGSISSSGFGGRESKNELTLGASGDVTASVTGTTTTSGNGAKTIFNVSGSGSTLTFGDNISTSGEGVMNIALGSDTTAVTLQGEQSAITTLSAFSSATNGNSLTLDATNNSVTATIGTVANGENLNVIFNGKGESQKATLKLNNTSGTTLKNISIKSGATTGNVLEFSAGANSILGTFTIGSGQDLSINLSGANTSLSLANGFSKGSGSAYINIANGANATLSGGAIDATKLSFAGTSALTINNSSASLGEISIASGANATLKGEAVSATTLSFAGTSSLNIANEGATITGISVASGDATLSGIALSSSNLTFADNTSLTLNNAGDSFALVDTSSASTNGATLTIGGNLDASIAKLAGNNLIVDFNRQGGGSGKLSILDDSDNSADDKSITLKSVKVTSGTNNTLDLSNLKTVQISGGVNVSANQELVFKLKDTSLSFANNSPSGGITKITVADTTSGATIAGTNVSASELEMSGANAKVIFTATQTTLGTLDAKASGKNELVIGDSGTASLTIETTNSTLDSVELKGDTAVLEINGGTQTINTLTTSATTANNLTFTNNNLAIGEIKTPDKIILTLDNSTLSLGSSTTIDSVEAKKGAVINLAVGHSGSNVATQSNPAGDKPARNTLTIGELNGDLSANVFVSKSQADRIVINDATNASGNADTLTLYARGNAGEIISITSDDNVLVADTSKAVTTNSKKVNVEGGISDIGGLVIQLDVKENQAGSGLWYVGETIVKGVDTSFQEVASSALAVNYDLYLANFNSLNKRMGELRDNPYSQGVWARVFGGAMSSEFGSGSKSEYVTAQAGYDYSLTLGDAKNYMGIAIAYGSSWTKANEGVGLSNAFLDNIDSQMVEVGIYNSYVMDSGWYNDTIFKFDYIMSDFDITASGNTSSHSTNNFAMVLSDEFGYRYKFAESEKGNWYIDPQVEVAFGYFNQSDFNQAIAGGFTTVEATQDAILTLRTRAGMSLGKKFNTAKGFASLYVGAFYEYDYIEGGNAQAQVLSVSNSLDRLKSNGRAIVNVGSNIELTEGVRMYIDVEKSFGDKQRTDMQFNFGARYSFGEKVPTPSYLEAQKKKVAPLKVEDKQEATTQESKTEAPANTEVKQ